MLTKRGQAVFSVEERGQPLSPLIKGLKGIIPTEKTACPLFSVAIDISTIALKNRAKIAKIILFTNSLSR